MINEATIVGRVGKKDFKELKNGSNLACFSVATNKKYKDSTGEKKTITTWHNVNFFGGLAEVAFKYMEIGNLVYIKGEINNALVDKGNEKPQWYSSIHGNVFKILPTQSKTEGVPPDNYNEKEQDNEFDDSDVPF